MTRSNQQAVLVLSLLAVSFVLGIAFNQWMTGVPLAQWPKNMLGRGDAVAKGNTERDHSSDDGHEHDHDEEHEHDHGPGDENSIQVSSLALKNLGLTEEYLRPIELTDYRHSASIPGMIVERPGRTKIPVSASMTGIVTEILFSPGEATLPNVPFIKLRLTHEDLVTLQTEYLQTLGKLDVELKEIERLTQVSSAGAVSPKTLLEREYNRDILRSNLDAQRESLRLHGIGPQQLLYIDRERKLLTEVTILTPSSGARKQSDVLLSGFNTTDDHRTDLATTKFVSQGVKNSEIVSGSTENPIILQSLQAQVGQLVNAGDVLGVFADYSLLLVKGQAFETDLKSLTAAKQRNWDVEVQLLDNSSSESVGSLPIKWIDSEIDPQTRTVPFYCELPNSANEYKHTGESSSFLEWRFRPGQRIQIQVPIEVWSEQFVLPIDAVTRDGLSSYVFIQNGDSFTRVEVHEKFRNTTNVVIENDGSVFPGDVVALRGAHQLNLAIKNSSGGGIDPHAGHNH